MSKSDINREEREWKRAVALRKDLAPYLQTGFRTRGTLRDFCRAHECSRATAYRWLKRARKDDRARALHRQKPGPKQMSVGLSEEHERIIEKVLRSHFLTRNQISPEAALKAINQKLEEEGLFTISLSTVIRRIQTIPDRVLKLKRHGGKAARQSYEIIKGRYHVTEPLSVVQIDHTILDIMVVDPDRLECIGRPYLTVLLDLATRMPTGIFLSMDAPSATNLMLAFLRSVFPKAEYLAALGIRHEWPAHGLPLVISSDNGTDLKSKAFNRGLEEYGVDHIFRPVAQPHLGGHVERFIGTLQRYVQTLPGTTFSSVDKKGTYQSEKQASLTLLDVEKLLLDYILREHVHAEKRRLLTTPFTMWNASWSERQSLPRLPKDPARFRLDFLPFEQRTIQREGLELFGMFYRCAHLQKMKNCGVQNVTIKYDPTDIRTVHISADGAAYYDARAEHFPISPMPLSDWKELCQKREERLRNTMTAADPVATHDHQAEILGEARRRKRAARKGLKGGQWAQGQDIRNLGMRHGNPGPEDRS